MHIVFIFNAENAHKYGINYFTFPEKLNSIIMEITFSVILINNNYIILF